MSDLSDLIFGDDGDLYAARGWMSAKALLAAILGVGDYPTNMREIYEDHDTPLAELRKDWTAKTTRGWMRPGDATVTKHEWDEEQEDYFYICERDHPTAEKWTYWRG